MPLACDQRNMQAMGSAITYARRYSLAALVGVCPEDDDGNAAGTSPAPAQREREYRPQPSQHAEPRQHNGEARQFDGPPKSGKGLFAALKKLGEETGQDWIKYANDLGKLQGFTGRITDWQPHEVSLVWNEVQRKKADAQPQPQRSDYDDTY